MDPCKRLGNPKFRTHPVAPNRSRCGWDGENLEEPEKPPPQKSSEEVLAHDTAMQPGCWSSATTARVFPVPGYGDETSSNNFGKLEQIRNANIAHRRWSGSVRRLTRG